MWFAKYMYINLPYSFFFQVQSKYALREQLKEALNDLHDEQCNEQQHNNNSYPNTSNDSMFDTSDEIGQGDQGSNELKYEEPQNNVESLLNTEKVESPVKKEIDVLNSVSESANNIKDKERYNKKDNLLRIKDYSLSNGN